MALDIPMAPLADLLPQVRRLAMAIDQSIIDDMLMYDLGAGASEFISRTKLFTDETHIDLQACVNDYPVPCQPGFVVHAIADARIDGRPLTARADAYLQGRNAPRLNGEKFYWEPQTQVIRLDRRNSCAPADESHPQQLYLRMVLSTPPSACEVPASIRDRVEWRDAVQAGAMYRLCDVHQPPRAGYWHNRFEELVAKAIGNRIINHAGARPQQMRMAATGYISR